jgi:hypothetical protein
MNKRRVTARGLLLDNGRLTLKGILLVFALCAIGDFAWGYIDGRSTLAAVIFVVVGLFGTAWYLFLYGDLWEWWVNRDKQPEAILQRLKPLSERTFTLTRWKSQNPERTHSKCCGCHAPICDSPDDDYHEGYLTIDVNLGECWVCPKCFGLFQSALNSRAQDSCRK